MAGAWDAGCRSRGYFNVLVPARRRHVGKSQTWRESENDRRECACPRFPEGNVEPREVHFLKEASHYIDLINELIKLSAKLACIIKMNLALLGI